MPGDQKPANPALKEQTTLRHFWIVLVAFLGAVGTGLQNYAAIFSFLGSLTRLSGHALQGLAIGLGGICSGLVNFCMNLVLLNDFMNRVYPLQAKDRQKQQLRALYHAQTLHGWTKVRYWTGIGVFVVTGILFGSTAFSFVSLSSLGMFTLLSIAAGLLVSIIMIIQELETWLSAFDPPPNWQSSTASTPTMAAAGFSLQQYAESTLAWFRDKSIGEWLGLLIALGNVLALSLSFTFGLAGLLITFGASPLAAVISGLCLAFTIGAFTEYYFYNHFMSTFCHSMQNPNERVYNNTTLAQAFEHSKWKPLGIVSVLANASVNGALCYSGILLLNPLLIAAGLSAIPLPVIILAAIFGGIASLLLGADFWIRNTSTSFDQVMSQTTEQSSLSADLEGDKLQVQAIVPPALPKQPEIDTSSLCPIL